jgi:hypothetical protein
MPESVQQAKVVDRSLVTHGSQIYARFLQFACISLALITQRIVLRRDA